MQQFRGHADPRADIGKDGANLEIQRICAEAAEQDRGWRVDCDQRVIFDDLFQDPFDLAGIGSVGHAHRYDDPPDLVVPGPVGDGLADQIAVRNDHFGLVERLDLGGADRDALDDALLAARADPVTDADRTLDQQDDARHEVGHDVLQAETDTDRQRTGDDGQR